MKEFKAILGLGNATKEVNFNAINLPFAYETIQKSAWKDGLEVLMVQEIPGLKFKSSKVLLEELISNQKFVNTIGNLRDRWEDEKEYEDWEDYEEAMKKLIPKEFEFVKGIKRPFGMKISRNGEKFQIKMKKQKKEEFLIYSTCK